MEGVIAADEGEVSVEKKARLGVLRQELVEGMDRPIIEEVMNVSEELREIRRRLAAVEDQMAGITEDGDDVDALLEEHGRLQQEFEGYGGYSLEARAGKVLQGLGFQTSQFKRPWNEFSGGWRMRVALARILLSEPDGLLLDEPTNHLDLESLLWVEGYLQTFKGALVIVSHDRAFLNKTVKKILEVTRGKVTLFTGNYDDYERTKEMQEEVQFAAFKNQQEKIKKIQQFVDRNRVKARTASRVQSRLKMIEKMDKVEPPQRTKHVNFSFPQPPPSGRRVLEMTNISKRFGDTVVYRGFSYLVEKGERLGLVGPNGAGKSTLLKIMGGVLVSDSGAVKYGAGVKVGYFAQHQWESLNSERTVLEEALSEAQGMKEAEVRSLLGAFLFSGDDVFKKVKVLSGGEKSRLALAKILLSPPNLLLMDEPTNHLDIESCRVLESGLKRFEGALVLITHDRRLMNEICTGILEVSGGSAEYYPGNYDEYRDKKQLMEQAVGIGNAETPKAADPPAKSKVSVPQETSADRKEKKRRQARARAELSKLRAPLKKEITRIEREIERAAARRDEIQALMADPKIYRDRGRIRPLLEEEPALTQEINKLEAVWEELNTRMEELAMEDNGRN
jgi:ATP-binding cassette subfamily F protein 3